MLDEMESGGKLGLMKKAAPNGVVQDITNGTGAGAVVGVLLGLIAWLVDKGFDRLLEALARLPTG